MSDFIRVETAVAVMNSTLPVELTPTLLASWIRWGHIERPFRAVTRKGPTYWDLDYILSWVKTEFHDIAPRGVVLFEEALLRKAAEIGARTTQQERAEAAKAARDKAEREKA